MTGSCELKFEVSRGSPLNLPRWVCDGLVIPSKAVEIGSQASVLFVLNDCSSSFGKLEEKCSKNLRSIIFAVLSYIRREQETSQSYCCLK